MSSPLKYSVAACINDKQTTRGGAEGLAYVQTTAQKALALGGALTPEGMDYLHALDRDYTRRNLSPGGCADLLAAAIFLHRLPTLFDERSRRL